jgi:hypothetical protein
MVISLVGCLVELHCSRRQRSTSAAHLVLATIDENLRVTLVLGPSRE